MSKFRGLILFNSSSTVGNNIKIIGKKSIKAGRNLGIGDSSRLEAFANYNGEDFKPVINIGNNCSFGNFLHIGAISEINIGDGVLGGSGILIIDHNHGHIDTPSLKSKTRPALRSLVHKGKITIEENVWIGDDVKILGGAHIGKGSIIQANTIVSKSIPPYSICTDRNNILDLK